MKNIKICFITTIMIIWSQTATWALVNEEIFSQFQFNLIPPGARAIAMGGAFIGLADDATAIESNPAGLTVLIRPEISVEAQNILYKNNHPYWHHFIIATKELPYSGSSESINIVYPYKRFVFSAYSQVLTHYEISYEIGQGVIEIPYSNQIYLEDIDTSFKLDITDYGLAVATEIFDGFSIAISPRWSRMTIKSENKRYKSLLFDPSFTSEIDETDNGFSLNAGILWKFHPKISLGGTYRYGATFVVKEFCDSRWSEYTYENDITLKVPDSFGIGVAFQPTKFLTVTLSMLHIQYKNLLKNFTIDPNYLQHLIHYVWSEDTQRQEELTQVKLTKENFTIGNAAEIHVGMEYIIELNKRLLAVRAGMYYEPDHTLRFTGTTGDSGVDSHQKILFPGGKPQFHLTSGIGFVMDEHIQMDIALNVSEETTQLSLSMVYRF